MSYQYDVFFSYKRDPESNDWHQKVMEKLKFWLKNELQKQNLSFFFDSNEIRPGEQWKDKMGEALKTSKVIVCIWSPLYFQSKYCVSEWKTFLAREEVLGKNLIMPASFIDGESFPKEAKQKQFADFSNYTSTFPTFWNTHLAVNFENELLKIFAKDLASLVKNAPAYQPDFPLIEANENEVLAEGFIGRIADV